MTQPQPPQDGPPIVGAPMLDLPGPQSLSWEKHVMADGTVVAKIWAMWPHVTTLIMVTEADGLRL